jgi:protein-L-isoaspartate(D-aspartate) O-methyltransferase
MQKLRRKGWSFAPRLVGVVALLTVAMGWPAPSPGEGDSEGADRRNWKSMRERMVERQIEARGVRNPRVLEAMRTVERHRFVPDSVVDQAYEDHPLPIGEQQTISQPYIVAAMTEALDLQRGDKVLEVGTGSGYQAAVLAELGAQVFSIEIVEPLARRAEKALAAAGYDNVKVIVGDGYRGLPDEAPFAGVIVTAAPAEVPPPLIEQLAVGAHLVIPVGSSWQELRVITRTEEGIETRTLMPVRFVPMTGEAMK